MNLLGYPFDIEVLGPVIVFLLLLIVRFRLLIWLEIQTMKTPDFLEMDGKTKKDIWIDMVDKREKQLNLKRAKL